MNVQVMSAVKICKLIMPKMAKAKYGRVLFMATSYVLANPPKNTGAYIMAKNGPPVSKFLKDRGVGKGKLLLRSFLSPRKNIKSHNPACSLAREAQRKSLAKRKRRIMGLLAPNPRKLLKKLDQNFPVLVRCEHNAFNRRAQLL